MVVVSGEALMDIFASGRSPGGLGLEACVGGSPLNVARGLARLGQAVAFLGALSNDFLGDRLLLALEEDGVQTRCTVRLEARCTLGLVGLDPQGGPSYAFYGDRAADRLLPLSALQQVPQADAFHFGSFSMVVEPVASTLRALVQRESGRALIAYDPNLRLQVEPDIERWRQTLVWMLPHTHVLKISEEDLSQLYPGVEHESKVQEWLNAGVSLVVLTRGAQGALAWRHTGAESRVPPSTVEVVDTVGAGDAFQAGLLTALAERTALSVAALRALSVDGLQDVLSFAARAAAITCSRRGADLPHRAELAELVEAGVWKAR